MAFSTYQNNALVEHMRINNSGNVGIGTSSPLYNLDVGSGSGSNSINIFSGSTDTSAIYFTDSTSGTGSYIGRLGYNHTADAMLFNTNATEAMRINSSGNLLVGTTDTTIYDNNTGTTADNGLNLRGDGKLDAARYDGIVLGLNRTGTDGILAEFRKNGTQVGSIGVDYGDRLYIGTGDTGLFFNNTSGDIQPISTSTGLLDDTIDLGSSASRFRDLNLSGGIFLGGTASANKLDDYEEGIFYYGISLTTSGSYTIRGGYETGRYTKIGNLVHIHLRFETISQSSPSGDIKITGLPFTAEGNPTDGNGSGQFPILLRGDTRAGVDGHFCGVVQSSTTIPLYYQSGTTFASLNASTVTGNFEGTISITYMTSQ
jgi:hypothetical protein